LARPGLSARAALTAGAVLAVALPGTALASHTYTTDAQRTGAHRGLVDDKPLETRRAGGRSPGHQHGTKEGHLPPSKENVELVGKLSPTGRFGDIVEGQIADLALFDDVAYLNSWAEESCTRGGVYAVDIRNPRSPKESAFIPALPGNYHGEGAHVIEARTSAFRGDLLAVNNEYCADVDRGGGFDLYDVSNPKKPKILVQGFGDFGDEGTLEGEATAAHSSHSVFLWQDGGKVYAVAVDNEEQHDVDIFDVSDPRNPVPVGEFDLDELFPQIIDASAFGDEIFLHDMVVKKIDGVQTMLASYWDAGYVKLDVSDPSAPTYLGDTSFDGPDPLFPDFTPPEGNAHQAEFSGNDRYVLAADEDFGPFRARLTVGGQGFNGAEATDTAARINDLADGALGPGTTFVGRACPGDAVAPAPADDGDPATDDIAVIVRGTCSFEEKVNAVKAQGWDGWIVFNDAGRPDGDPLLTAGVVGTAGDLPGIFVTRADALNGIFGITNDAEPPVGTKGQDVSVATAFDGWGYAHLYRNENGKMTEVDTFAINEARDERFATRFGDLSIHEFATDPRRNLAYSSYYSGGLRVLSFGEKGLDEVGHFIDEGGNNFWGVEFTTRKGGLIAASDRDYGLYLFRYTGPKPKD
jgi:hypothetical protein